VVESTKFSGKRRQGGRCAYNWNLKIGLSAAGKKVAPIYVPLILLHFNCKAYLTFSNVLQIIDFLRSFFIIYIRWMRKQLWKLLERKENFAICFVVYVRHIMSKLDFIKIWFSQPTSSSSDVKFSLQPRFHDNQSGPHSPKSNHVLSMQLIHFFPKQNVLKSKTIENWSTMNPLREESSFNKFFLIRALLFYFTVCACNGCIVPVQQSSSRSISYSRSKCSTSLTSLSLSLSFTSYSHLAHAHTHTLSRQFKTLFAKSCAERERESLRKSIQRDLYILTDEL